MANKGITKMEGIKLSNKQRNLTDKEIDDLQNILTDTLASVCAMADTHNIDRDSMLKYFADMITAFAEVTSIQNYKANHTNADKIRSMSDEELAEWINTKNTWEQCAYEESACMKKLRVNSILRWLQSEAE